MFHLNKIEFSLGKPKDVNWYLKQMVEDLLKVLENGLIVKEEKVSIKVRCFICDTPARCFVKGMLIYISSIQFH